MSGNLKISRLLLLKSIKQKHSSTSVVISKSSVSTSSILKAGNIFNVQDEEDFKKRVIENNKTVIVDFHAV
jgi:hypothetical protein